MRTIKDRIEERIGYSPYLRDALARGLVNMSALARELQPGIAKDLKKEVSEPAVLMALKRYSDSLGTVGNLYAHQHLGNLSLRADLFQLTVANSERLLPILSEILSRSRNEQSSFLVFTRGAYETSIVMNVGFRDVVESWMANERVTRTADRLIAISLERLNQSETSEANMLHLPLQILAWEGVNAVDVISTAREVTMIVHDADADRAIATLRSALQRP